jgi:hypothetical protein
MTGKEELFQQAMNQGHSQHGTSAGLAAGYYRQARNIPDQTGRNNIALALFEARPVRSGAELLSDRPG